MHSTWRQNLLRHSARRHASRRPGAFAPAQRLPHLATDISHVSAHHALCSPQHLAAHPSVAPRAALARVPGLPPAVSSLRRMDIRPGAPTLDSRSSTARPARAASPDADGRESGHSPRRGHRRASPRHALATGSHLLGGSHDTGPRATPPLNIATRLLDGAPRLSIPVEQSRLIQAASERAVSCRTAPTAVSFSAGRTRATAPNSSEGEPK